MVGPRSKNLSNQKFGKWTAIKMLDVDTSGNRKWLCKCDCGHESIVGATYLLTGKSKQCLKCAQKEMSLKGQESIKKHPKRKMLSEGKVDPVYRCWIAIKMRCYNQKNKSYKDYGARGIKVCDRWSNSFDNFKKDMGPRLENTSIERINNDGNYEQSNCKWATKKEQDNNRRTTRKFTLNGITKSIQEWSEHFKVSIGKFYPYVHRYGFEWTIKNLKYIKTTRQGIYKFRNSDKWSSMHFIKNGSV